VTLAHWDDVDSFAIPDDTAPLGGRWQRLGDAAGSIRVGLQRVVADGGQLLTPPHVHSAEEEIYHVLGGSATLWQDGSTCTVAAGDTLVFTAGGPVHTLIAGPHGLDLLVFGTRLTPESGVLPRTGVAWLAHSAVRVEQEHPWAAEAKLGLPEGTPGERPPNVVAFVDVEAEYDGRSKRLAAAGGSLRSGLNWDCLPAGEEGAPPHCHSAEDEIFVVLDGTGTLELWGRPEPGRAPATVPGETHELRRGHVVARPAGTRISHSIRAVSERFTYLSYGTREPNDICYYPRSNKIFLRGIGLIGRLEPLDYSDGEPS
jgi:uncharacterized cupin superfamily protein